MPYIYSVYSSIHPISFNARLYRLNKYVAHPWRQEKMPNNKKKKKKKKKKDGKRERNEEISTPAQMLLIHALCSKNDQHQNESKEMKNKRREG